MKLQSKQNIRSHFHAQYTRTIRTGVFYSNCTVDPAFVSVALHNRQVRNIKATDFNTERWVRDAYTHIYMTPLGNEAATLSLSRDEKLEIFFCPLQLVKNVRVNENYKNPYISSLVELDDPWYGNVLALKTVNGQVVDLDPAVDDIREIDEKVGE